MTTIKAEFGPRSYDIVTEHGLCERAGELLVPLARDGRLVVVSDEQVWAAQGARFVAALGNIAVEPIVLPVGEASKSWATLAVLVDQLLALEVERSDHIVAFGGGVIGDLVGFAAAIVKRGCNFVQVPTSLLAQVDSSVGGKTAINVPAGKNMVGAFHQPALVLIDPAVLATLPDRHMRAGYAEIVKYALIEDAEFFGWLEANAAAVLARDPAALAHAIATAVAGKAKVVAADERETKGRRALLNLGHTFGHALEAETGFSDRLFHGEAVAAGTMLAFDFSVARGLCPASQAERVRTHLAAIGLPTTLASANVSANGATLVAHMMHDKKREGGKLPFILARAIGGAFVDKLVALEEVSAFLDQQA
ncbi:3-dehydroquinate synthase [Sphingomonas sp.]|uniref:3-dehydroquinate synthase n=1 Tax=Sphingomonas sp. TaxID=28214 RepID=UPI00286A69FC|nr:3-dehydroquinate synthase [Sphingomonas sp.]